MLTGAVWRRPARSPETVSRAPTNGVPRRVEEFRAQVTPPRIRVLLAVAAPSLSRRRRPSAAPAAQTNGVGSAERTVMFASDGMRPDLMEKYAAEGVMPTYKELMEAGVTGDNGMLQAFPPNTGVGWFTMATGAYPADHGSTNNTYFRAGDAFTNRTSFSAAGVLQADTIANAAERAGKKVAQIDWVAGAAATIKGPTVDFTNFFTNRGVLVGAADPGRAGRLGLLRRQLRRSRRSRRRVGWSGVPAGDPAATPKETTGRSRRRSPPRTRTAPTTSTSTTASSVAAPPTTTSSSARSARPARAPRSTSPSAISRPSS